VPCHPSTTSRLPARAVIVSRRWITFYDFWRRHRQGSIPAVQRTEESIILHRVLSKGGGRSSVDLTYILHEASTDGWRKRTSFVVRPL